MKKELHIGVLTGRTPYPNGMAASQRIHLMARSMADAGAAVNIWVDGLDVFSEKRNIDIIGLKDGIHYEYLLGKTQAAEHKWKRVLDRIHLALLSRQKLSDAACNQSLDVLYYYASILKPNFERIVVGNSALQAKIPVVLDLREAPWSLKKNKSFVEKLVSPLWGIDGVICISHYLENWVKEENKRTNRKVKSIYVPILTDTNEIEPAFFSPIEKTVLFAGSPVYSETISFLLEAMKIVWSRFNECRLVITGGASESTLGQAILDGDKKIRYTGFVERSLLLREYSEATVLAIPLFDNIQSHARFPTKLGEYLTSGRPVVTNGVGEIPRFLCDKVNACVSSPGDIQAFAEAICFLLSNPEKAKVIGRNGRHVAVEHFHYANYGKELCEFMTSLS